jgi:hypothetical protein
MDTATTTSSSWSQRLLSRERIQSTDALLIYLALVTAVAHLLVGNNYGYFRDELYYIMDGRHLAVGYVDQPPLIGWLAWLLKVLAGDALFAIHILPALVAGAIVVFAGLFARELGGGRWVQLFTGLASTVVPVFMATGSIFSMDVLDALWWTIGAFLLARLIAHPEERPRLWLLFGLVMGIGLLTKLTVLFFGLAVVVGLLLTTLRAEFRARWPWLGGLIAFAFLLPYAIWNAANGWPTWEFWHHYGGLSGGGPLGFLLNQVLAINPLSVPLAIFGLYWYFGTEPGRRFRALGWTFVVLYVVFTLINAKSYFLAPAYPIVLGSGAMQVARLADRARWRWLRVGYPLALALIGVYLAPVAMPILPPASFVAAYGYLTGAGNGGAGQANAGAFPQYLGDRFGWDTMTAQVARVYRSLPPAEQAQACIFTQNYGEASALNLLGPHYHLPLAISGHNNYYLWGPGTCSGRVMITVNQTQEDDLKSYKIVQLAGTITCQYCMSGENDVPIYVCTEPRAPVQDLWRVTEHFD